MTALGKQGIGTRPFFRGLHDQPALKRRGFIRETGHFPVADKAYKYGFYLPSGLTLTDEQIATVCKELGAALRA